MDGGGGIEGLASEIVDGGEDARGFEMPFREETIGGNAAVERAGGNAVEIGDVAAADGAETVEVEMRVFGFEGIEGPFDETDAAADGVFALEKLEETADTTVAIRGEHGGHVRVEIRSEAVEADNSFGEADELVSIEGAENLAAGVVGDDEGDVGLDVEFGLAPDFAGDIDAALEFVESVERTDGNVGHKSYKFSVISSEFRRKRPGTGELGDKTRRLRSFGDLCRRAPQNRPGRKKRASG